MNELQELLEILGCTFDYTEINRDEFGYESDGTIITFPNGKEIVVWGTMDDISAKDILEEYKRK